MPQLIDSFPADMSFDVIEWQIIRSHPQRAKEQVGDVLKIKEMIRVMELGKLQNFYGGKGSRRCCWMLLDAAGCS